MIFSLRQRYLRTNITVEYYSPAEIPLSKNGSRNICPKGAASEKLTVKNTSPHPTFIPHNTLHITLNRFNTL